MIDETELQGFRDQLPDGYNVEAYKFFDLRWDIVKARFLISQNELEAFEIPAGKLEEIAKSSGLNKLRDPKQLEFFLRYVDHDWAISDENKLDRPIILGCYRFGDEDEKLTYFVMDGGHRVYKAYHCGKSLSAHVLAEEETMECMI